MGLNYQDLELPIYRNTREIVHFAGEKEGKAKRFSLTLSDYVLAAELSGLNMLFISDVGRGKSQLVSDIDNAHFAMSSSLWQTASISCRISVASSSKIFFVIGLSAFNV